MTPDRYDWRRVRFQTGIFFAGAVSAVLAAGFFNVSGLTLGPTGFGKAMNWDPTESGYGVAFGLIFALGWLGTVFLGARVSSVDVHANGVRVYGWALTILNILLAGVLYFFALVLLPAQYGWVP